VTEWYWNWQRNGWKTAIGADVLNRELIEKILELQKKERSIRYEHVYGHSGVVFNELADRLANAGRLRPDDQPIFEKIMS
jgi:ribonuclease HI